MENYYIMWLNSVLYVSTETKFDLINYFGSAKDVYNASADDIIASGLVRKTELNNIIKSRNKFDFEKEIKVLENSPATFYSYKDSEFPKQLRKMKEPPLGLYIWGKLPKCIYPFVSIVGTRKISEYGSIVCHKISYELAESGINIVSGMAYGTDSVAHKSCIEAGGKTIAVLGCGVDVCYPASNRNLRNDIVGNGCVISEFPLGTNTSKHHFPYRNRLIACLSSLVVVIEAEIKSGSLITANHALDNGRNVMAVPGNITSKLSEGTNKLIADGCQPVLSTQDILDNLNIKITDKEIKAVRKMPDISNEERVIFDLIEYEPVTIDEICVKSKMSIQIVSSILMMLELKGCIMKMSGQKYVRSL